MEANLNMRALRIIADENMPLVDETFGQFGSVTKLPGRKISPADVRDADILLVRSVTKVNAELLKASSVKFVGTATIGTDHLDQRWLDEQCIMNVSAPGCNADSVAEYVVSCLAGLSLQQRLKLEQCSVGIVGAGNVGQRVANRMNILGLPHLQFDPLRPQQDSRFFSCALEDLLRCNVICLHAPLTREGDWPSFHMIGESFLSRLADGTVLISAGRGPVVDFEALKRHQHRLQLCLDVWEPEPEVQVEVLKSALVATPHVAGYSLQSKWRGTTMLYSAYCQWQKLTEQTCPWPEKPPQIHLKGQTWQEAILEVYNPFEDTLRTKNALLKADNVGLAFDQLRKNYPLRHEFCFPQFSAPQMPLAEKRKLESLGFVFSH